MPITTGIMAWHLQILEIGKRCVLDAWHTKQTDRVPCHIMCATMLQIATKSDVQAEAALLSIQNESYQISTAYMSCLARCNIMNGKPEQAWKLYLSVESSMSKDTIDLLQLIADDCYGMGHFFVSAKAFQVWAISQVKTGSHTRLLQVCSKACLPIVIVQVVCADA
jgi:hypothetical protein